MSTTIIVIVVDNEFTKSKLNLRLLVKPAFDLYLYLVLKGRSGKILSSIAVTSSIIETFTE